MRKLPLNKGYFAKLDEDVYDKVMWLRWHAHVGRHGATYASRRLLIDGIMLRLYLHRLVAGAPKGSQVCFRNGDTLDCRRINLRAKKVHFDGFDETLFKGVTWDASYGLWRASIKGLTIGRYASLTEAALAYNDKMIELYGPDADLNEVDYG